MKVEKKGGRAKSSKMLTVQCSICGIGMDCPESMLSADRHFCARCTDLLSEGYEPEELKMNPESLSRHFERCDERLAKEYYLQGASPMLGLLISTGMPPPFLDDLEEAIREAKMRMWAGK
jgi:hypothetical protein